MYILNAGEELPSLIWPAVSVSSLSRVSEYSSFMISDDSYIYESANIISVLSNEAFVLLTNCALDEALVLLVSWTLVSVTILIHSFDS